MSGIPEIKPVLEDSKFNGVKHVNVEGTVQAILAELANSKEVEFIARHSEISRAGLVMKRVEE